MNQYPGYLTPDDIPFDSHCRTFRIPNSTAWLSVFMGALIPLIYPESWQKDGNLTTDEAAEEFLNILWDAYENDEGECPTVPTPFWDTVADADDEYPEGELAPWYGTAVVTYASPPEVTFTEQLAIWLFAGFIAYSGQVGAAIAYLTIAPKFVIALKTGNFGAIVDIIVDASRVGRYDTYSEEPGIMRIPVVGNPDNETHQIYIVKDDNPYSVVEVVRDELNPDDVAPPNRRYVADGDKVQIQGADGEWGDNAGADPRSSPAYSYPPITADDVPCQAASNMSRWINNLIDEVLIVLPTSFDAAGLLTLLIGLLIELGPFGILIDLALALAFIMFSAGTTALSAAFTSEVFDQLTCIFYCNVDANGQMSPEQLTAVQARVDSEIGGLAATVLDAMFFLMGNVGLSNAGTIDGGEPVDCGGCACEFCHEWDATEMFAEFTSEFDPNGGNSVFLAGSPDWSSAYITHIEFTYTIATGGPGSAAGIYLSGINVTLDLVLDPGENTCVWDGSEASPSSIEYGANGAAGDSVTISHLLIRGNGVDAPWSYGNDC